MSDENKLKNEASRGVLAKQIIENPCYQNTLQEMKLDCFKAIQKSKVADSEKREEIYLMLKTIEKFETIFERHIKTGKMAQSALDGLLQKLKN